MKRRSRSCQKALLVGGKLVESVNVMGLANIVGKSRSTILRYERTGVFPSAPFRLGEHRYYPLTLAKRLVPLVARIPSHTSPAPELLVEINRLFNEETNRYAGKE